MATCEETLAPLMNFLRYSREYLAVEFAEWISISSEENSALALFRPAASTMNLSGVAVKVQASETTSQSSMTSTKESEFILTTDVKSHSGSSLSSMSTSTNANEKSRLTLSSMPSLSMLSARSKVNAAPGLHLLRMALKLSRLIPRSSSFSSSNSEKRSLGREKKTMATFAGSNAVIAMPSGLTLRRTSVTMSEIMVIMSARILGLSSLSFIFFEDWSGY